MAKFDVFHTGTGSSTYKGKKGTASEGYTVRLDRLSGGASATDLVAAILAGKVVSGTTTARVDEGSAVRTDRRTATQIAPSEIAQAIADVVGVKVPTVTAQPAPVPTSNGTTEDSNGTVPTAKGKGAK